jgi:hypothetical protein
MLPVLTPAWTNALIGTMHHDGAQDNFYVIGNGAGAKKNACRIAPAGVFLAAQG